MLRVINQGEIDHEDLKGIGGEVECAGAADRDRRRHRDCDAGARAGSDVIGTITDDGRRAARRHVTAIHEAPATRFEA